MATNERESDLEMYRCIYFESNTLKFSSKLYFGRKA